MCSSPMICRASYLNIEGKQVAQVLFALAHPYWMLSVTLSLMCLDRSQEALLCSFARL